MSPSSSELLPTDATIVSPSRGLVGERVTLAMTGRVLDTTTAAEVTAAPSSSPSLGVTEQATDWFRLNEVPSRVALPAPASTPSTVQK